MSGAIRVLVCGGRQFSDLFIVSATLNRITHGYDSVTVIHGGAQGADSLAGEWAKRRGAAVEVYEADWTINGRAAGAIRNRRMFGEGQPDVVVAFAGGRGTEDMVRVASKGRNGPHVVVLRVQCCPSGTVGGCEHQRGAAREVPR